MRGKIHLFLGSSPAPVGGNKPPSPPKSQGSVREHATLPCPRGLMDPGNSDMTQSVHSLKADPSLLDLKCPTDKESALSIRLTQYHCELGVIFLQNLLPTPGIKLSLRFSSPHPHLPQSCSACHCNPFLDAPGAGALDLCVVPGAGKPGNTLHIPAWHCAQTPRTAGTGLTAASSRSRSAGRGSPSAGAHSGWLQRGDRASHREALTTLTGRFPPPPQVPDTVTFKPSHTGPIQASEAREQKHGPESIFQTGEAGVRAC